ncbi:MAG TPA: prepilin-type N-terminal cleavage/methylation domain-containing protein [Leptolyngbyaceae cyanobacterium]
MLKLKLLKQQQGFTLVEVLVAILITTIFISVAMQAIVIAAVFKVRARQYSEATNWIQEDLESVRQRTSVLGSTTLSDVPIPDPTNPLTISILSVPPSTTGFGAGNRLQIGTINDTLFTISNISGSTIKVTPALTLLQIAATPAGTPVSVVATASTNTTLCYASASDKGFGNFLSSNLLAVPSETDNSSTPNSGTKTIAGKTYTLLRTPTVRNSSPYEVMQLTYKVAEGANPEIATFNTEVIPNAAFQCPS